MDERFFYEVVLTKLSGFRNSLGAEEKAVLDRILMREDSEVEAHAMQVGMAKTYVIAWDPDGAKYYIKQY